MKLKTARKIARLTQPKLAKLAGVKQETISQIETGDVKHPDYQTVMKLCRALNVEPHELFPVDDEASK